jgi:hypothetical protein
LTHRIHVWKVIDRDVQESVAEQSDRLGYEIETDRAPARALAGLFSKAVIVTYRCVHCPAEKVVRV